MKLEQIAKGAQISGIEPGVKVRISVEIEAESSSGFDDGLQRAVRENCDQLKFKNRAFDE